jgi:pimeloyl-ACP methyl ester carboxylesterase
VWHNVAQIWQTPGAGEELMSGFTAEAAVAVLAADTGEEIAAQTAGRVDETMKSAILDLYRSAVTVGAEWGPDLDGFDRPSLALWGADDPYCGADFGQLMAKRLRSRLTVFESTGHWWPVQRAQESAAELERLWAGVADS